MVGHLLLLGSAGDSARGWPPGVTLILSGLEQSRMHAIVARQTLCGALDTVEWPWPRDPDTRGL